MHVVWPVLIDTYSQPVACCSPDVDLSEQIRQASLRAKQQREAAAAAKAAAQRAAAARGDANAGPTQAEGRRWLRSGRYSRQVSLLRVAHLLL